jgi:hypothetical protein
LTFNGLHGVVLQKMVLCDNLKSYMLMTSFYFMLKGRGLLDL